MPFRPLASLAFLLGFHAARADGRFGAPVKPPKGASEYRAVAEQSSVAVEGDTKLVN